MYTNVKRVAVVDDQPKNLAAAKLALEMKLPGVAVTCFSSEAEIILAIKRGLDVELIISDMKMEDKHSGYRVAVAGWSLNIPTAVVSGGPDHGTHYVYLGYPYYRLPGDKDQVELWCGIIEKLLGGDRHTNGILTGL